MRNELTAEGDIVEPAGASNPVTGDGGINAPAIRALSLLSLKESYEIWRIYQKQMANESDLYFVNEDGARFGLIYSNATLR